MRIYKFRGFHADEHGKTVIKLNGKEIKGTWYKGDLSTDGGYYIQEHAVIPETVGQFTGLNDSIDKEIYEGDILRGEEYPYKSEGYHNYYAEIVWFDDSPAFGMVTHKANGARVKGISDGDADYIVDFEREKWEIIGNIFENPELLEVEE